MRKVIVYNRHEDGGVTVCWPTNWAIRWLSCGGFWGLKPRGWYDRQIASQIARGVKPDAARRYVRAMISGGCTTAEALEIIRDRDCAHLGYSIELWDADELPRDRWFRDAWKRSHNGGPISIDLEAARPIQFHRIKAAVARENKRRADDLHRFDLELAPDYGALRSQILKARDETELRHVWPAEMT